MNLRKNRSLCTALAGIVTMGTACSAHAVNVSPDGRGQVLLYPYYTTRSDGAGNTFSTLLSVVNPSGLARAVKVRFFEGRNNRSVLDFNLFLSPYDVWTAAVLPDLDVGGARVGTLDTSCTLPSFAASPNAPFIRFSNAAYAGLNDDGAGTTLDRAREGFFEIIEMASYSSTSTTGRAITHVNGTPPCGATLTELQAEADARPLAGGLFGSATLINVNSGTDYTAEAVALANFNQIGANYFAAGDPQPDLDSASPPMSIVYGTDGTMYTSLWTQGAADPVSAVLIHDGLLNEYTLDTATKSGTDWVVTMPTKRFYVAKGAGAAAKLFQRNFNGTSGACDDVLLNIFDREERSPAAILNFTPPPPTPTSSICWGTNVITFNQTNVLGSSNVANLQTPGYQNGWFSLGFPTVIGGGGTVGHLLVNSGRTSITIPGGATTFNNSTTYFGLPVIGFAVVSFTNGTLQAGTPPVNVLSNYGGDFRHKTNTTIQ